MFPLEDGVVHQTVSINKKGDHQLDLFFDHSAISHHLWWDCFCFPFSCTIYQSHMDSWTDYITKQRLVNLFLFVCLFLKSQLGIRNTVCSRQQDEKDQQTITSKGRMAGDTWRENRSARLLRQQTQTPLPPSNCSTSDTNTHSCQEHMKIIHKTSNANPSPATLLGITDTVSLSCEHTPSNLSHTHTHRVAGGQRAVHVACGESLLSSAD